MLRNLSRYFDNMVLGLALWLCVLPLVGLLVAPLFGLRVAALTAAALAICWGICSWKIFES